MMEIMVVLVIIGLLAGLVGVNVRGYLIKAKRNAAKTEIATICDALEAFYTEYDRYPSNEEGLLVLTTPSERMPSFWSTRTEAGFRVMACAYISSKPSSSKQ